MSTLPPVLENVPCEICGETRAAVLFTGSDRLLGLPGSFTVVECAGCGLVYTNPRPDAVSLAAYYPESYGIYDPEGGQAERLRVYHDRIARRLTLRRHAARGASPGRVLDIGCGDGTFLGEMERRGWKTTGLEMDSKAAERARARRGLQVIHSTVEEAAFSPREFDLITLSHLLEHVPHPRATLRRVRTWLKEDGRIFITLPNVQSWERRLFKDDWYPWDLPRHLYHFSSRSLRRLLGEEGYELVDVRSLNGFFVPQSIRYWRDTSRGHRPGPTRISELHPDRPSAPPAAKGPNTLVLQAREAIKTAAFRSLLSFADVTGRFVQGEILEVVARKRR